MKNLVSPCITFLLFALSFLIAGNLCIGNGPDWILITVYWVVVSIKYGVDLICGGNDGVRSDSEDGCWKSQINTRTTTDNLEDSQS